MDCESHQYSIPDPPVHSYDEWTQLHEVIIGCIDGFRGFHFDNSFNLFYWENVKPFLASKKFFRDDLGGFEWPLIEVETEIIAELAEDINALVETIRRLGIVVRQPGSAIGREKVQTPFWESYQCPPLNVRDQTIIMGQTILETAPHVRARLFENDFLKPLFYQYLIKGARWLCMPRPTLCAGTLDPTYFSPNQEESDALKDHHALALPGLESEIIFDGAQCIRLGKDILVNVANRNHELGFQWLEANFGNTFHFHRLNRMADTHIDSIILPLREGLWLCRSHRYLDFLPDKFRKWDFIIAPEIKRDLFPTYESCALAIASKFIDMNILSINETTVVANTLYPELIRVLEKRGFDVVAVQNRHRRLFGGGFHCFTLDVSRSGGLESYC